MYSCAPLRTASSSRSQTSCDVRLRAAGSSNSPDSTHVGFPVCNSVLTTLVTVPGVISCRQKEKRAVGGCRSQHIAAAYSILLHELTEAMTCLEVTSRQSGHQCIRITVWRLSCPSTTACQHTYLGCRQVSGKHAQHAGVAANYSVGVLLIAQQCCSMHQLGHTSNPWKQESQKAGRPEAVLHALPWCTCTVHACTMHRQAVTHGQVVTTLTVAPLGVVLHATSLQAMLAGLGARLMQ